MDKATAPATPSVDWEPALERPRRPPSCSQGVQSKGSIPVRSRSSARPRVSASSTASLALAGYTRPVEMRCCFQGAARPVLGSGWHRGPQPQPGPAQLEVHGQATQLEGLVLAAQPGIRGRQGICLATCLIVVDGGRICLNRLPSGAAGGASEESTPTSREASRGEGSEGTERVSVCGGSDWIPWDGLGRRVVLSIPSFIPSFTICDG